MYDCRKSWGLTKFRFGSFFLAGLICLFVFPICSSAQESLEEPVAEPPTVSPEASLEEIPVSEESALEEPAVEESQVGENALRGALAIIDGADPDAVSDGGLDSDMLNEGASMVQKAILQMFGGLAVVLALILFVYWGIRKFGKGIPALAGRQLGQVVGQLQLTRDATLFYVRTGGRVLLISLSSGEVRTIAEFDETAFSGDLGASVPHEGFAPERFVAELKEQSAAYRSGAGTDSGGGDDDMAALRSDIHRLQEYLQEETRGTND